jgi:hypothetical protein
MRERAVSMGAEPVAGAAEQPDPPQADRLPLDGSNPSVGTSRGSRLSAASRGLFRLVGRVLRLN